MSPAVLGGGPGNARGAPRFVYGFVHLERSGYLDALQKWDLRTGAPPPHSPRNELSILRPVNCPPTAEEGWRHGDV